VALSRSPSFSPSPNPVQIRVWPDLSAIRYRKYYRRWMLYVGLFLPWLNGIAVHMLPALGTSGIVNGVCVVTRLWPSQILAKVWLK